MKHYSLFKWITIICLILFQVQVMAQVNVSIQILPPYPTKFTDYASKPHLMVISVTNASTTNQKIQLRGTVTGDNGIVIRVRPTYKSTSAIELGPGQTRMLNGNDISYFFDYNKLEYSGITQSDFINKGGLPEGRYQLCIRAYDYDSNAAISADEPAGCSNSFSVASLEPPIILSPFNGEDLSVSAGQVIQLRWNTPVGTPPGIQYRIRMVEVLGNKNPNDAMMTARQPYFFDKEVMSNIYIYNPADPQLTIGRRYALMIEAFDPSNNAVFRNQGRSEVISFTYGANVQTAVNDNVIVKSDTLSKKPVIVKGNLKYRFPESPESGLFSLKETKVYLEKVYVKEKTKMVDTLQVKEWVDLNPVISQKIPFLTDPIDGVVAQTDAEGNFELKLGMTVLDSAGILSEYHKEKLGFNKLENNRTYGNMFKSNTIGVMYKLRISNPHFNDLEEYLRIVPGDSIMLNQKVVDAKSFLLNVNVRETFNNVKGKFVAGAKVRIYRFKADKTNTQLEIPQQEGDLLKGIADWKVVGDKVLIAEAFTPKPDQLTTNDGNNAAPFTVSFKRLFKTLPQVGYQYLISLEKGNQVLSQMSYDELVSKPKHIGNGIQWPTQVNDEFKDVLQNYAYNAPRDTANLTINKELIASPKSKVTGKLSYKFKYYPSVPNQPYANMKVSLRSSKDLTSVLAATTTDKDGKFVFDFANIDSTYKQRVTTVNGNIVVTDRVYYVVPEVKYYAVPNEEILVQPWASYDCGELVSMVQTYALKIDAQGPGYEPGSYGKVDGNGKSIPDKPAKLFPMRDAEVLVMRSKSDSYLEQRPNMPGMNLNKTVSFGNGDVATNSYTVLGENDTRENLYSLHRSVNTGTMGEAVTIKGLIPSLDAGLDVYHIRVGSVDRSSSSVAYETTVRLYPYTIHRPAPPQVEIDMERFTPQGMIELEKNQLYDPTQGRKGVAFDPGGAVMSPGFSLNILNGTGLNLGGALKVNQPKAITGGRVGLSVRNSILKPKFLKDFASYAQSSADKRDYTISTSIIGPVIRQTNLVFNNQLPAQEQVFEEVIEVNTKPWRIAGRVLDFTSRLGIPQVNIGVSHEQPDGRTWFESKPIYANDNGDFVVTVADLSQPASFYEGKKITVTLYKNGYEPLKIAPGIMKDGTQIYNEQFLLNPLGKGMFGNVVDMDDVKRPVTARIKMFDNGVWVNTEYKTDPGGINARPSDLRILQQFKTDLPAGNIKLVILPYDRAYIPDTIPVSVDPKKPFLGDLKLRKRTHKINIAIFSQTNSKDALVPAVVTIMENGLKDTINVGQKNRTKFIFVNNSTKSFTAHIKPLSNNPIPGKKMFVPQTFTFSNEDDGINKYIDFSVRPGRIITGKVAFDDGSNAVAAKVYVESGNGTSNDNFSLTNDKGEYNLILQDSLSQFKVRANYFEEGKTFVPEEKIVGLADKKLDFIIKKINNIDASRLFGFKTKINTLKDEGAGIYVISGELFDIPKNSNFSTTDSVLNRNIAFENVKIKVSTIKNTAGVPLAIPIENTITTNNKELGVKINKAFNGIIHAENNRITINKSVSDTSGVITGKVRILDNSFEFPSSYMTMQSTDFYLGVNTGAEAMPVFTSNGKRTATNFKLTNKQGQPISFKYLGFKGVAETQGRRTSILSGEKINLYMNLSTTLPGNIPLTLKAGLAEIAKGGIGKIITTDTVKFNLENWTVSSINTAGIASNWELSASSGGLVIKGGEIITGKLNVPFKELSIIPSELNSAGALICNDINDKTILQKLKFNLGGVATLKINDGSTAMFVYDPGVGKDGKGHYKFSIANPSYTSYAASFSGLDGMTKPGESFKIQIISMLSNGEELFGFLNNQVITYYNQIRFTPLTLSSTSQSNFSIAGNIDLGIPYLNDSFYKTLIYTKDGLKNKLTFPELSFSFMGMGNVKFTSIPKKEAQQIKAEGFVFGGNLELPGGVDIKGAKLVSMVTKGSNILLDAMGALNTSPYIPGTEIKREVDILVGAKEDAEAYLINLKSEAEGKIKEAKDALIKAAETAMKEEVTKVLAMGGLDNGNLEELAGAWKLGNSAFKQGQDIKDVFESGDPMKVAGLMRKIPGLDDAIKDAKNAVIMTANNTLNAVQESLPKLNSVPVTGDGFKPGKFVFDLKNGKIFGSISFEKITIGAVGLRDGGMEMMFDRGGWYFCTGATMDIPVPLITPLKVGMLVGNYGAISPEVEARVTQMSQSVSGRLPDKVRSNLSGLFVVGGKPLVDYSIGFGIPPIAEFKLVASAGAELRSYAMFGKNQFHMGMGALIYGRVFASASGLGFSVSGGADVNVAIASTLSVEGSDIGMCIQGCGSIDFTVQACAPIVGCGSLGAGVRAIVNLGIGNSGVLSRSKCLKPGLDFSISTAGGSCINSPDFDF